jgi:hypothetical protein
MGIRFACPSCGYVMNVKDYLGGKRGFCKKCQAKVDIPLQSTAPPKKKRSKGAEEPAEEPAEPLPNPVGFPAAEISAYLPAKQKDAAPAGLGPAANPMLTQHSESAKPTYVAAASASAPAPTQAAAPAQPAAAIAPAAVPAPAPAPPAPQPAGPRDPISEAPHMQWYVLPPGATQHYGPAPGDMFLSWIREGRVSTDSMVWRQDWPNWQLAGSVLPQLAPTKVPEPAAPAFNPTPAGPAMNLGPAGKMSPAAAALSPADAAQMANQKRSKSFKLVLILAVVTLLLFVAVLYVLMK